MKHLVIYTTPSGQRSWAEVTMDMPTKNFSSPITYGLSEVSIIIAVIHNIHHDTFFSIINEVKTDAQTL